MIQKERVLPADVFDTIDLSSYALNGIGAGKDFDLILDEWVPCCIHGQADAADNTTPFGGEVSRALFRAGISRKTNDEAVRAINKRKGSSPHARVDFLTEYVPELNITRGE